MSTTKHKRSFAIREEMRIGAEIANQLPKLTGLEETAKIMGISHQMVRRIECRAFYKMQKRLREIRLQTMLSHE